MKEWPYSQNHLNNKFQLTNKKLKNNLMPFMVLKVDKKKEEKVNTEKKVMIVKMVEDKNKILIIMNKSRPKRKLEQKDLTKIKLLLIRKSFLN